MLDVTDAAVEQLSAMLDQTEVDSSQGIRLVQNEGELGLRVDMPQEGDQVVAAGERPVLLIDPHLSRDLDGATLDAVDTTDGKQLALVGADSTGRDTASGDGAH